MKEVFRPSGSGGLRTKRHRDVFFRGARIHSGIVRNASPLKSLEFPSDLELKWMAGESMPVAGKSRTRPLIRPRPKSKFQADLAPAEDRTVRTLKAELQLNSNADFLSDAVALFQWAVNERKRGHRILSESASGERRVLVLPRLERVAPQMDLPRVELQWTEKELQHLAALASGPAAAPTDALIRAMRR